MFDISPSNLLISVLVVLFAKQLINAIGKATLENIGWSAYCKVAPKLGDSKFIELDQKRSELAKVSKEKKSISAQDQYARWTKLNRQSDKLTVDINKLKEETSSSRSYINKYIGYAILVTTTLPIWFFRVWFRKAVLFYFPTGVLPYHVEWFLALPFITTGGVGLTIWMTAVNNVISSVIFLIKFPFEKEVPYPSQEVEKEKSSINREKVSGTPVAK
ncbi:Golgi to ER traffic protein 1 [Debaryomyces fabryi]|uniref:Golgi to ER traffic protein 1 n=1 Tax=Debaryomyces fabryi TaxID=58627 RepID=A0A0V1PY80_9ASCO|nr:Golgi to ER traffic protein 1 [Debaryomyces fabryi]KSA01029.1 Golgi to ER traffic protein 1 [Debaryomyces fabryi]CUM51024.1 unnamed protein product [Debaryomyces fabryi]